MISEEVNNNFEKYDSDKYDVGKYILHKSYKNNLYFDDSNNLSSLIFNNLNSMTEEEKKYIMIKCLNNMNIHNELLMYEFQHYMPTQQNISADDFLSSAYKLIHRYHYKLSESLNLEDIKWLVYKHGSAKYKLQKNDYIFENTMSRITNNDDTRIYLRKLIKKLENITMNYLIFLKYIEIFRDDILYVIIYCKYVN